MKRKEMENMVEVDAFDLNGKHYKCPIKVACLHKFLSSEENWEAIYDLIVIIQNLNKNSLKIIKDENGFVKDVKFCPTLITDDIITFAFQNIWKFVEIREKTKISEEIIIKTRREELLNYINESTRSK